MSAHRNRLSAIRAFAAYHSFMAIDWLYWRLLPYAGEWAHRDDGGDHA